MTEKKVITDAELDAMKRRSLTAAWQLLLQAGYEPQPGEEAEFVEGRQSDAAQAFIKELTSAAQVRIQRLREGAAL